jgi:hypothetical protein
MPKNVVALKLPFKDEYRKGMVCKEEVTSKYLLNQTYFENQFLTNLFLEFFFETPNIPSENFISYLYITILLNEMISWICGFGQTINGYWKLYFK